MLHDWDFTLALVFRSLNPIIWPRISLTEVLERPRMPSGWAGAVGETCWLARLHRTRLWKNGNQDG